MTRVIVVHPGPYFSVADVHRGWVTALVAAGCSVVDFNLGDRLGFYSSAGLLRNDGEFVRMVNDEGAARLASKGLEAACYEFGPDVVLIISCFYLPPDTLDTIRAHGSKVVILHTEEPYEHDRQLERGKHADLNLLNDPSWLDDWRAIGPAEYIPHAYDPAIHRPGPVRPECCSDFVFVGTGYPGRIRFLEAVDFTGVDVALAGHWQDLTEESPLRKYVAHDLDECCDNTEAVDLYRATLVSANIYRAESDRPELAQGWSCGPREIELAAVGVPFLRDPRGESDALFPMHPTFDDPDDFADKLHWWLAHPTSRAESARQARSAIVDRTFDTNVRRFLTLLERL